MKQCITCNKILIGKQTKFCCRRCRNIQTNHKHQVYASQQERALRRKTMLLEFHGSKCSECGYCKNYAALSFHHLDPSQKLFQLDFRSCSNHSWESLVEEAKKCQLLCLNCHAETHHPSLTIKTIQPTQTSLEEYSYLLDQMGQVGLEPTCHPL